PMEKFDVRPGFLEEARQSRNAGLGKSITFPAAVREHASTFYRFGGSPIGNSRVKLTNVDDCTKRGLVQPGEEPLKVAAERLKADGIDILHTIGGDDTNTTAADLAAYLHENGYDLTVVGLPKTIDNDVYPIKQTLGAWTASEQSALFFSNIANENTTAARQLIIHEVMGRHCGWLTARAAYDYHKSLSSWEWLPEALLEQRRWDVDAVWVPEMEIDMDAEVARLRDLMDEKDSINIFVSEGAGLDVIVAQMKAEGNEPATDAFGHYRLDDVNVGKWFGEQLKAKLDAEKVLVQKSGYFARSAAPNAEDLELIKACCVEAASSALAGKSGVAGHDEDNGDVMATIAFPRIKGGKPFNIDEPWFDELLNSIGQPKGEKAAGH
ncbi:MAG: pyrophosphate--fructose-6-phosphate 1-phosphotransferase, partial [Verrucomicrobiota bacterium]